MAKIIEDMPEREYRAAEGLSQSTLCELRRSPAHAQYRLAHHESTPAMDLGSLVHCMLLDHETFHTKFATAPDVDRRTQCGKEAWALFTAELKGRKVVTEEQFDKASSMFREVCDHGEASRIIADCRRRELSMFWEADYGIPAKGRIDLLPDAGGIVWDLKTTADAGAESFDASVRRYGYHIQAAWYLLGVNACGVNATRFGIIAVESEPPHGVAVYELDPQYIDAGLRECERLLAIWRDCVQSQKWPAYPDEIQNLTPPTWWLKHLSE